MVTQRRGTRFVIVNELAAAPASMASKTHHDPPTAALTNGSPREEESGINLQDDRLWCESEPHQPGDDAGRAASAPLIRGGRPTLMTNIVVLIKQVPDTWSERKLTDGDFTLDREAADAVLDEINERAVEEALLIREKETADGTEGSVTVLTAGPERATEAIRKALSMGADKAVHLLDDGMRGSDVIQTGWALARALGTIEGTELVIAGNESTDGVAGAVPAIIAEYLGLPQLTHLRKLSVEGGKITGERETDDGLFTVEASLPAVVSVNEKINEPRFPSFKGIMAAKKKEVTTLTLAEIGVEADEVGLANAGSTVLAAHPKPPKTAGEKVTDEGDGGTKIAGYLIAQKLI
jgi:electron transfer flavoprotein beta subunit